MYEFCYRLREFITCAILQKVSIIDTNIMKIFDLLTNKKTEKLKEEHVVIVSDAYQASLNKLGKEQFVSMLNRGLRVPIALM